MKIRIRNLLYAVFIFLFVMICNFTAFAETLNKPMEIIDLNNSTIKNISEDGSVTETAFNNESFYINNGVTYINVTAAQCFLDDEKNFENIINDTKFYKKSNSYFEVYSISDTSLLKKEAENINSTVYVPLRDFLNSIGYDNDEIIYNSYYKTVSINEKSLFETDKITVADNAHYYYIVNSEYGINMPDRYPYSKNYSLPSYDVSDSALIDELIGVLNEEPFYETDAVFRSLYPQYILDFNNGVVMHIDYSQVCTIYENNERIGRFQLTFKSSLAIEKFIKSSLQNIGITFNDWWYDIEDAEDIYSYEYIAGDYINNDYSLILNYLRSKVTDFDDRFTYSTESNKYGGTIIIKHENRKFTINVGNYGGVKKRSLDGLITYLNNYV